MDYEAKYKAKYKKLIDICRRLSKAGNGAAQDSIIFHQDIAKLGKEVNIFDREIEIERRIERGEFVDLLAEDVVVVGD